MEEKGSDPQERRGRIREFLLSMNEPTTGASLATRFKVTRQVIVQDIAILKAEGLRVISTPKGYMIIGEEAKGITRLIAVKHEAHETKKELYAMVDCGVEIVDVIVDHPVYGQLTGQLSISSRHDADAFVKAMDLTGAGLLSSLTDGVHLHTVNSLKPKNIADLLGVLKEMGYLLQE